MRAFSTIVGVILLAGCSLDTTVEPPVQHQWHGPLIGAPGWDNLQGDAGFVWTAGRGQFAVGIAIREDEPFAVRPWHVHQGTCETGGPMIGLPSDYDDLIVGQDGTAEVEVVVGEALNPNRSYFVDVHLSDQEIQTVIACGNTILQTEEE